MKFEHDPDGKLKRRSTGKFLRRTGRSNFPSPHDTDITPALTGGNPFCCCKRGNNGDDDDKCGCPLCSFGTCGPCYRITISGTTTCGSSGSDTDISADMGNRCVSADNVGLAGTCDGVYHASPTGNPCEWIAVFADADQPERSIGIRLTRETNPDTCAFRWHVSGYRVCVPLSATCGDCSVGVFFNGYSDDEIDNPCVLSSSSSSSTFPHDCSAKVTIDNLICHCGYICCTADDTSCGKEICKECFIDFFSSRPPFAHGGTATVEAIATAGASSSSSTSPEGDSDTWCRDPGNFCSGCRDLTPRFWQVNFNGVQYCSDECDDPCDSQLVSSTIDSIDITCRQDPLGDPCVYTSDPIAYQVTRCDGSGYTGFWTVVLRVFPPEFGSGAEVSVWETFNPTLGEANHLALLFIGGSPDPAHACCGEYDLDPSPFVFPYRCGDPQGTILCALFQADTVTIAPGDVGQDACGTFGHSSSSSHGGGSSSSSGGGGDTCSVPCRTCGSCRYCTDMGATTLEITNLSVEFGVCDDCDFSATGDGGVCYPSADCCGATCAGGTPPPCESCVTTSATNKQDCEDGGGTWSCCGAPDGVGISECDGLSISGPVSLPLVAWTTTTQTFNDTILGTTYNVQHTCAGDVADTWEVTITKGHCRAKGIIQGACDSFSGTLTDVEDTSMANTHCSNGFGEIQATVTMTKCTQ